MSFSFTAKSSHIVGGDTKFIQIGPNQFKVVFRLIRYCNGIAAPVRLSPRYYDKGTNILVSSGFASLDTMILFSGGSTTGLAFCVEDYTYIDTVTLPNNPNRYYVSYGHCCRALTLMNHMARGQVWTADIPNPAITGGNSSPAYTAYPSTMGLCVGVNTNLDFSCIDPNGDSLVYSLVQPIDRTGSGGAKPFISLSYKTGYSLIAPLGPGSTCTINPSTGIVTGKAISMGIYVLAVKCEEFRSGFKIGEVIREAEVPAINCTLLRQPLLIDFNKTLYCFQIFNYNFIYDLIFFDCKKIVIGFISTHYMFLICQLGITIPSNLVICSYLNKL